MRVHVHQMLGSHQADSISLFHWAKDFSTKFHHGFHRAGGDMALARINIEAELFTKKRWTDLVIALGDRDRALGALNWAWIIAQRYYVPKRQPIPKDVWLEEGLRDELIKVGLAEEVDGGVRVCGSEEQFGWLFQRHEAGAKGGRPKKEDNPPEEPQEPPDGETEQNRSVSAGNRDKTEQTGKNRTKPSLSFSSSKSSFQEGAAPETGEPPPLDNSVPIGQDLVATYCMAWKSKYGDRPPVLPSDTKKLKTLGESVGRDKAKAMIAAYLRMQTTWFITKRHDVETLMSNLNVVQDFLATGKVEHAIDWDAEADAVFRAAELFKGEGSSEKAREWLGEIRWVCLQHIGGLKRIRGAQDDELTRRKIAKALKQADAVLMPTQNQQQCQTNGGIA
jgi:hypothetical protein